MKRLIAALMLTTTPAIAFDISAMDAQEKAAFGEAVREFLMTNPEVLVEAINVMEERRIADEARTDLELVAAHQAAIFDDSGSWVGGNPDGDLTMVEFIDYRCGVCRRFNQEVHDLVEQDGNIKLILKEFPILNDDSEMSSRFAVAVLQVAGSDAYFKAHEELMDLNPGATTETLTDIANRIGVDADKVIAALHSESVTQVLRDNHALAQRMGIKGTPTFVIGGELLRGVPAAGLTATVQQIRAEMEEQG